MASFRYVPAEGQAFSANSTVYPNAKRTFYLTGTNTKSNVYQDSGLTTPHTNPVVADSAGLFPAIYLNQSITYKVVLQDEDDNIIDTTDPVGTELGSGLVPVSDLSPAANKFAYYTGSTTAALADLTSYGRQIIAVTNEAALKELVNLEIGTDVQAQSAYLDDIAAITPNQGEVLYFNGTDWVALGVGTAGQMLQTNGAGANPAWVTASQSPYVQAFAPVTIGQATTSSTTWRQIASLGTKALSDGNKWEIDFRVYIQNDNNNIEYANLQIGIFLDGSLATSVTRSSYNAGTDNTDANFYGELFTVDPGDMSAHEITVQIRRSTSTGANYRTTGGTIRLSEISET